MAASPWCFPDFNQTARRRGHAGGPASGSPPQDVHGLCERRTRIASRKSGCAEAGGPEHPQLADAGCCIRRPARPRAGAATCRYAPVVFVTARGSEAAETQGLALGALAQPHAASSVSRVVTVSLGVCATNGTEQIAAAIVVAHAGVQLGVGVPDMRSCFRKYLRARDTSCASVGWSVVS